MPEFDEASKHFGPFAALDSSSFAARPGRLTGFRGPNGAAKTTAMRTVFELVELDSGAVLWRGAPVCPEQHAQFGYMPEERGLYPHMRVPASSSTSAGSAAEAWTWWGPGRRFPVP